MSTTLRAVLPICALLGVAAPGLAEEASECPKWFPDFSCDRQGRFEGFTPPMTMPYYFEEPFVTSGVSAHLLWHEFPNESAFQGGSVWVVAVQARIAITERLAFIATKDGLATFQPDPHFGRILAAYGGVFVAGSLAWGVVVDRFRPDRWDLIGATICLVGVAVIMYAPRG